MAETITFNPIGVIHSPFTKTDGMPIQPPGAAGVAGTVEVFEQFRDGLMDLDGFSHVILLYLFHQSRGYDLHVTPFLDDLTRGVFATRAPRRPNPLGLSILQLDNIEDGILYVSNIDILDGAPLIDIKPYVPDFDAQADVRTGWLEKAGKQVTRQKSEITDK